MAESARVRSIEAIRRFRELLTEFAEATSGTLASIDSEIGKARGWLEHDMPAYWKQQIRLWERRQVEARSALHRKNLQRTEGYIPDVTEEKEVLRQAKERIEEAHRKLELIRRWGPELQHAISEYKARTQALQDMVGPEAARSLALLDRMTDALDAYIATTPPRSSDSGEQTGSGPQTPHRTRTLFSWSPQADLPPEPPMPVEADQTVGREESDSPTTPPPPLAT